jgi:hypothetical protein
MSEDYDNATAGMEDQQGSAQDYYEDYQQQLDQGDYQDVAEDVYNQYYGSLETSATEALASNKAF